MKKKLRILSAFASAGLAVSMAGCGQGLAQQQSSGSKTNLKIGVLFPDTQTPHWENQMWPGLRDSIAATCADCKVLYSNVQSDAVEQQNQADSMLAQGVNVLVLAPVNGKTASVIVEKAKAQNVPVIGFASIPEGPISAFVGIDVPAVGEAQGKELLTQLQAGGDPKRGCVIALNGDAQTPATDEFKKGRAKSFDSNVNICATYDIQNWSAANAQTAMDQAITSVGKDKIIGVYAMNDGIAAGAIAAMHNAGFSKLPPVSGGDASLAGIQRVITGDQGFTMNADIAKWGSVAAPAALAAARGEQLTSDKSEKNSTNQFPWFPTPPARPVTSKNLQTEVIDGRLFTYDQICTTDYLSACEALGLKPAA
ncbi:substrate-binding domain-containing protein [Pseudarthrobacter phenanthrenivorans]|uniref:substrate-binding domain-containing protein n=1 Tax=Pseudarthrobacter phenanthrenivorans TaxID=361575 RepID=UPI00344E12CD